MKRAIMLPAVAFAAAFTTVNASAHADIGVFFGIPGPVVETAPVAVYAPPPPVYSPPVVYGYGYRVAPGYWRRRGDDDGWREGWRRRHEDDDDD